MLTLTCITALDLSLDAGLWFKDMDSGVKTRFIGEQQNWEVAFRRIYLVLLLNFCSIFGNIGVYVRC